MGRASSPDRRRISRHHWRGLASASCVQGVPRPSNVTEVTSPTPRLLVDHGVSDREQVGRNFKAKSISGLGIDDKLKPARLMTGRLAGFTTFQDTAGIDARQARYFSKICPVAHKAADRG
jgi:hypothetical protein